jgi:hypothetical protein
VLDLDLPAGSLISFVVLFVEGSTVLSYDLISAVESALPAESPPQ